uniref:Beta-ureidopropionase n=1 Tax=Percolomonas cosmopolitus TaxID=63605 RepID=A0A7S1KLX5_9EUKA
MSPQRTLLSLLALILTILTLSLSAKDVELSVNAQQKEVPFRTAPGVDVNDPITSFESVESILEKYLPEKELAQFRRIFYGKGSLPLSVPNQKEIEQIADKENFEFRAESVVQNTHEESSRPRRVVRIGAIQNAVTTPTTEPIKVQKKALIDRLEVMIDAAGKAGVQVLSLQEAWTMPFAFATREKNPWMEFAEDAEHGESTQFIKRKARQWNMVIISPILERDSAHADTIWNTAVVIGNHGNYIGKHRKNHIPRVASFAEATYYLEGNTGHPVFETAYGRIAINICYGRHHPLNWQAFALNGAEIIFNPSATVAGLSEGFWAVEARNAAIANNVITVAINRVGTEWFPREFTNGTGGKARRDFGHFYGSTYLASSDGSRTNGLSRVRDGLLVVDADLNQNQHVRDSWMFQNTARFGLYAKFLTNFVRHDFKPQIIRDPAMERRSASTLEHHIRDD